MYAVVRIVGDVPPNVGTSYDFLRYGNYGVCCWEYEIPTAFGGGVPAKGPVHFLNFLDNIVRPEYPNPIAFHYVMKPNVQAGVVLYPETFPWSRDIKINGIDVNLLNGKGLPFLVP